MDGRFHSHLSHGSLWLHGARVREPANISVPEQGFNRCCTFTLNEVMCFCVPLMTHTPNVRYTFSLNDLNTFWWILVPLIWTENHLTFEGYVAFLSFEPLCDYFSPTPTPRRQFSFSDVRVLEKWMEEPHSIFPCDDNPFSS